MAVAAYAELQNVQVGSGLTIRSNYWMRQYARPVMIHYPGVLTIPAFYNHLISADEGDKPLSATFGGISIAIGMPRQEVIDLLLTEFAVQESEPVSGLPDARYYQIIGRIDGDDDTYRGGLLFDNGTLVRIHTNLGQFDASDAGSIMTTIVDALEVAKSENKDEPQVSWDTGMYDGDKARNTELKFDFDGMSINVVYFDMPNASQSVNVTRTSGIYRWRAFPLASDFKDE